MSNVAEHYNARPNQNPEERRDSTIFHLRCFNNWVKAVLIREAMSALPPNRKISILDIGCGKGGDLGKYRRSSHRISSYHGIDIAPVSIEHARQRASEMRLPFPVSFAAGDCYAEEVNLQQQFDLVSCQFSLHYAFKTAEMADRAMGNMGEAMAPGGLLILTLPNADRIMARYRQDRYLLMNEFHCVRFTEEKGDPQTAEFKDFGEEYTFWLVDAIDSCAEYLVKPDILLQIAKRHGLRLINSLPFDEFFVRHGRAHHDILVAMNVVDQRGRLMLSRSEMPIAELYCAMMFIKE